MSHAASVTEHLHLPALHPFLLLYAAPLLALVVAFGGGLTLRRGRGAAAAWSPAAGAASVLAGWALLGIRSWVQVAAALHPRTLAEHLVTPALVTLAAAALAAWLRLAERGGRWLATAVALFGGWWLAGAAGAQFWRVWVAVAVLAWVLHRAGVRQGRPALAAGLALWLGLVLAGAPYGWVVASLVLAAAAAGAVGSGAEGMMSPALFALGVVAADLGAGRLAHGRVGPADLVCVAAVLAALCTSAAERLLRRRAGRWAGRWAPSLAPLAAAVVAVAAAWLASRVRLV